MIKKFAQLLSKAVFIPKSEIEEVEESPIIGEDTSKSDEWIEEEVEEKPYTGIPAPAYLEDDPWFPAPVLSEAVTWKHTNRQWQSNRFLMSLRIRSLLIFETL